MNKSPPRKRGSSFCYENRGFPLHVLFLETLIVIGGASLLWNSWR
jgi:hypothetical protein